MKSISRSRWLHRALALILFTVVGNFSSATASASIAKSSPLVTFKGTPGFWRLGKSQSGVWWFLRPGGNDREFMNGVSSVQPVQLGRDLKQGYYHSLDFTGPIDSHWTDSSSQEMQTWAEATIERVRNLKFKMIGAWSNSQFHQLDVDMTQDLNLWSAASYYKIFDPRWKKIVEEQVVEQVKPLKDRTHLVGYYTDNELDWWAISIGPQAYFNDLASNDPNRQEVIKVMRTLWPEITAFNLAWHSRLQNWEDLDKLPEWKQIPNAVSESYNQLTHQWLSHLSQFYFKTVHDAIRAIDTNHLILGVRYRGFVPPETAAASIPYVDAQSMNYYVDDGMLTAQIFQNLYKITGQPIVVSEYSFHSLDNTSNNRNNFHFPNGQVVDQQARAEGYQLMTSRMARVPYVIGGEWFQWNDEPAAGRLIDGEDVNFGIFDVNDKPYKLLTEAVQQTSPLLNQIHETSATDPQNDVWRPDEIKSNGPPNQKIFYLKNIPALDGSLRNWDSLHRFLNLRSMTLGAERLKADFPAMWWGWNEQGIYFAFHLQAPELRSSKDYWMGDAIELWVSTEAKHENEKNYYRSVDHQFFVAPTLSGDGFDLGEWYRAGDALNKSLRGIPQSYVHSLREGSWINLEVFLPFAALDGFRPDTHSSIGFNLNIHRSNPALSYFWSASKDEWTQLDPTSWGRVSFAH